MGFWLAGWLYGNIPTLWIMVMTSGLESAGEILLTLCFSYQTHTFAFYSQLTWISTVITARGAKWQKVSQISSHISQGGGGGGGEWGGQIGKLFSLECAAAVLAGDETLSVRLWCDVTPLSLPPPSCRGQEVPPPPPPSSSPHLLLSVTPPALHWLYSVFGSVDSFFLYYFLAQFSPIFIDRSLFLWVKLTNVTTQPSIVHLHIWN